ncbi:unnamed protein product [Rangifer tarandus platyrhynchus]|uniref:Uncharacterized protein n=1 Tax=Rangifer tarandus platyrhynchus TaxID=3082113 RepID=A0ACB1KF96_RANTA
MSNLSRGTGSRKDTKMRIRAFPDPGPASHPPRHWSRGSSLPGNQAARGPGAAALPSRSPRPRRPRAAPRPRPGAARPVARRVSTAAGAPRPVPALRRAPGV